MPDVFAGLPCRDEDVARELEGDYATLAPRCEYLTGGTDGAMTSSSWDLTSADNDFAAQGIQAGHVVVLESRVVGSKTVSMGKQVLGITGAAGTALTLHRIGYDTAVGRPPGAPSGISGVTFSVPSVLSHIKSEAVEVRNILNIAADVDLSTLPDLTKYTAIRVARWLYFMEYRQTSQDTWEDKYKKLDAMLAGMYANLKETYGDVATPGRGLVVGSLDHAPGWSEPPRGGDPLNRNWRRSGQWG